MASLLGPLIGLADNLANALGLEATITHYAALGQPDGAGKVSYASGVKRKVIYARKMKQVRGSDGQLTVSNAQLVFLSKIKIGMLDKIVLPDGTTQPIVATDGFVDSSNGSVFTQVYLG